MQHQTDAYKWQFAYIGANLEAIRAGDSYQAISNQVDARKATADGLLSTPGEMVYNSFKTLSKSTESYRGASLQNYAGKDFIDLDTQSDADRAAEIKKERTSNNA